MDHPVFWNRLFGDSHLLGSLVICEVCTYTESCCLKNLIQKILIPFYRLHLLGCLNKIPQTGWLKQQKCIFLQFQRLQFQIKVLVPLRPLFAASYLITGSSRAFSLCCAFPGVSPSSYRDTNVIGYCPTLLSSSEINYPFKDLIFKYGYLLKYWDLGLQQINLGGISFNPAFCPLHPQNSCFSHRQNTFENKHMNRFWIDQHLEVQDDFLHSQRHHWEFECFGYAVKWG